MAAVDAGPSQATEDRHVVFDEVAKTYDLNDDHIESIRRVSLGIARAGFVSILGPSGCGKSTLLMMLAGLVPTSSGQIVVNGQRVEGPRRETSLLFQTPTLFPWRTVLDNVLFPIEI